MHPTLQQLQIEITDALHELDSTQTQATPPEHPEKWSIQQIVQHLRLTYASTADAVEARLAKGRPTKAKPTILQRLAQFSLFTINVYPDGRKAPELVTPAPEPPRSGDDLTCSTAEHLAAIDKLLGEAEALFGSGPCISHFLLGPLSVEQWRRFHLLHGDHHVRQILAIRAGKNF
jgi:hypothetical protein